MDLDFNSEQNLLRETAAKFFAKECPFENVKEIEESDTGYSKELWARMAELGWMGVFFPEEYGGYGGQFIDLSIIMEEMGKAALPSPFFSTVIQCGLIIMEGASEDQKKELLREQLKIRAGLPQSEKTRLALVLPWLDRSEPTDSEGWQGDG